MTTLEIPPASVAFEGIVEHRERDLVIISPANRRPIRRVLFVNLTGGVSLWRKVKEGVVPPHHLWDAWSWQRWDMRSLSRNLYQTSIFIELPSLTTLNYCPWFDPGWDPTVFSIAGTDRARCFNTNGNKSQSTLSSSSLGALSSH